MKDTVRCLWPWNSLSSFLSVETGGYVSLATISKQTFSLSNVQNTYHLRFLWPCIVSKVWREKKNQQDSTIRCLLLTSVAACFGHHCAHPQKNKDLALLASYNAAPHNRYQPHPAEPEQYTVCSNTRSLFFLKMGIMMPETGWDRSW